ncbi:MAG TPA: M48 family metalloprotease [Candidatus Acidoferrum sp.]|nr:M48 family metalloprotease [Candidatus Acidoferrum sp.]
MSTFAPSSTLERPASPPDRESFFDAQRRNRRAAWRLSAVCVLSAAVMGIPLALTITPLLYAVGLLAADLINLVSPLPPAFWQQSEKAARFGFVALGWLLQHKPADPRVLVIGSAVLLLPGTILSLFLWLGMSTLFRRGGVGGALLALKAREPNQNDLKELRLADVVQEMAIAAGLPAPRVMLVDAPGANVAAIGSSPADARLVVSRRMLDELSRDELEGALAHSIASIGNGDLRIAFQVVAIFETCGVLLALVNSPFGSQSRRTLWRILRYAFANSGAGQDAAKEADAVAGILTRCATLDADDIDHFFDTTAEKKSMLRSIRNFLLFPIVFTNFAIKLSLWFFSFAVLGPSVALLWRTRQYLADASAVQLTRNPEGLADALQKLTDHGGAIPGSGWAAHLFLISPTGNAGTAANTFTPQQTEVLAKAWLASAPQTATAMPNTGPADFQSMLKEAAATYRAAFSGDAQATARIRALKQSISSLDPSLAAAIPDPADFAAARKGDAAAMVRLQALRRHLALPAQTSSRPQSQGDADQSSGISSLSFVSFHPSLKRRLKRLNRMGAHRNLEPADSKMWIVATVISLIFAPFLLLAVGLLLLLIGVMILSSLAFLTVWLAFIHQIFVFVAHH